MEADDDGDSEFEDEVASLLVIITLFANRDVIFQGWNKHQLKLIYFDNFRYYKWASGCLTGQESMLLLR